MTFNMVEDANIYNSLDDILNKLDTNSIKKLIYILNTEDTDYLVYLMRDYIGET